MPTVPVECTLSSLVNGRCFTNAGFTIRGTQVAVVTGDGKLRREAVMVAVRFCSNIGTPWRFREASFGRPFCLVSLHDSVSPSSCSESVRQRRQFGYMGVRNGHVSVTWTTCVDSWITRERCWKTKSAAMLNRVFAQFFDICFV